MKDVAAAAGVSLGTVSNVLNRPDRVSTATRERVERVIAELGFVRNESARQLRSGNSDILAYLMLDTSNPFFNDVADGVEVTAEAAGLSLFTCNTRNRADRERTYLDRLREQRVQGILITPTDVNATLLAEVRRSGTPLVIVDRTPESHEFCSVSVDDELGGRLAIEHLVDRGHVRVAFVGGPSDVGQVVDRLAGARAAWSDAGLPSEDLTVFETGAMSVSEGRMAGQRIAGLGSKRRPTAAFCVNDLLALGLLQHAVTTGVGVPEQLAIVGYDDIEFAAAAAVPLTSVRQPRQELGKTAARLVIEEASDPHHAHRQVVFTPELIARGSTVG